MLDLFLFRLDLLIALLDQSVKRASRLDDLWYRVLMAVDIVIYRFSRSSDDGLYRRLSLGKALADRLRLRSLLVRGHVYGALIRLPRRPDNASPRFALISVRQFFK